MALKKSELIEILVNEYGYEKEDLKVDANGKPYTNAKLQSLIKAEEEDAKNAELESTRLAVEPKSTLKDSDKIYIMNGLTGTVYYHSPRSNLSWEFKYFGQQEAIEYGELKTMRNRYPRFFTEGWLIVLDREVQKEFNLEKIYQNILTPENIESVFEMSAEELDKFIDALPEGQKTSFINKAQELFETDKLSNYQIIKMVENKFNFKFEDNAPLNDVIDSRDKIGLANIIVVDKK